MYDFETARRRAGIGAEKWDMMTGLTGYVPENMVPFSIADMEFLTAPEIMDALRQAVEFGEYGYTIADEGYRAAVCGWFARRHGWTVRPEWMVQTYGVVSAMLFALYQAGGQGHLPAAGLRTLPALHRADGPGGRPQSPGGEGRPLRNGF